MLLLASASPRRREILTAAGIPHRVCPANISEDRLPNESARAFTERMAIEKAHAIPYHPEVVDVVLAADTMVLLDDHILGKPDDDADASRMLGLLSGRMHRVITSFCLRHVGGLISESCTTLVHFAALTPEEIADYTQSGEGRDKAGAYAIQGRAGRFVERIEGCYYNVVGLPLSAVYRHLKLLKCL